MIDDSYTGIYIFEFVITDHTIGSRIKANYDAMLEQERNNPPV